MIHPQKTENNNISTVSETHLLNIRKFKDSQIDFFHILYETELSLVTFFSKPLIQTTLKSMTTQHFRLFWVESRIIFSKLHRVIVNKWKLDYTSD